jgi:hypothetical protein
MSEARLTEIFETTGGCYGVAIAKGLITGAKPFVKIGFNGAVGTTEEEIREKIHYQLQKHSLSSHLLNIYAQVALNIV